MELEKIQEFVGKLPGVTEDIKWGNDLCFLVAGKMFSVVGLSNTPLTISFKTTDEKFAELISRPQIIPAPYLAKHHWVYLEDIHALPKAELLEHLNDAHMIIAKKLPAKKRKELGIE